VTPRAVQRRSSRSRSRSRSPYRREQRKGREGYRSPYDRRGGRIREDGAKRDHRPQRKGPPVKERSLSPYSKRLALTQALGR
jgi:hypothetical protein